MEQDALAVSTGLQKPYISPEVYRCYRFYRFYRFTDLQALYDFSDFGPTRARMRATTRSVAAAQVCCIYSFPRAHARGGLGAGQACCTVVQECRQLVAAWRACGVVGRRGHAHARMQRSIDFGTKSAYFRRQSGCTARIRKAWRWRGSEESPTRGSTGSSTRSIS